MDRYWVWGAGTLVAIAAVVGLSTQSSRSPAEGTPTAKETTKKILAPQNHNGVLLPGICSDLESMLQAFLLASENDVTAPDSCYSPGTSPDADSRRRLSDRSSGLKFVIATLPDPLHTHLSLLFDRKIEAIQQAAQDAGYDYDSSWLPWDTEEHTFTHLADQDAIDIRKDAREEQPGLLLFRKKSVDPENPVTKNQQPFQEGLAVFVAGEEATRGIHRRQFQNAAAWIAVLQGNIPPFTGILQPTVRLPIAILGPTFSGSFSSLAELLASADVHDSLNYTIAKSSSDYRLRVFSGSVSGKDAAESFGTLSGTDSDLTGWHINFHSFIQDDDMLLRDYCDYLNGEGSNAARVAIISEDETAYGIGGIQPESKQENKGNNDNKNDKREIQVSCPGAVRLFYPRDISALRAAYQAQSIFSPPASQQSSDSQRRTLSTNLADPAGQTHDTVASYGGNQTPLAQEAQLLGILGILQDHRSEYLVIRSSNTLDQLFLTTFFRRLYPQGRVVILATDTLFLRESGYAGVSGVMMLSTYPLFPWDWTDWMELNPNLNPNPAHRVFGEQTVEGTYVAMRFLVQDTFDGKNKHSKPLDDTAICSVTKPEPCFTPPNLLPGFIIPDYKAPFWEVPKSCQEQKTESGTLGLCDAYSRPATWISVLGRGGFEPIAAFAHKRACDDYSSNGFMPEGETPITDPPSGDSPAAHAPVWINVPFGMKICLTVILAFAIFNLWCCWGASFTAKPAFRAHFATIKGWFFCGAWQHPTLITIGSALLAFIALASAWSCGAFCIVCPPLSYRPWIWAFLLVAWLICLGSVIANQQAVHRLETFPTSEKGNKWKRCFVIDWKSKPLKRSLIGFFLGNATFILTFVILFESSLKLPNHLPVYWRSMNLNSGVSPLVPFLVLFVGMYMWFWYSLHGLALFGLERPRLPSKQFLFVRDEAGNVLKGEDWKPLPFLRMFSQEKAAEMESAAIPLERCTLRTGVGILIAFVTMAFATTGGIPLRSLGASVYAIAFFILFSICISWMLAEVSQLLRVWRMLKQLLSFLDRIALRRTMSTLQGFSWGNVWRMSGNVLDIRYKLLSRQVETLNRLGASFREIEGEWSYPDDLNTYRAIVACRQELRKAHDAIRDFAPTYGANYDQKDFSEFSCLRTFQKTIADLVGKLLSELLIPAWQTETESLIRDEAKQSEGTGADSKPERKKSPQYIRNAEELVCITYLAFVQNILGRIRTIALGIVWLFVAVTISVSMYPFDPRPTLNKLLVFLFLGVGAAITSVYAEMHRDSTLSRVTNTTPGELGTEFWFKIIGFGVGPLIGLVAYIFPGVPDFLFTWLEPSMASFK